MSINQAPPVSYTTLQSSIQKKFEERVDTNVLFESDSSEDEIKNDLQELPPLIQDDPKTFNEKVPNFEQRVHLYLKPTDYNYLILVFILLIETFMSWIFLYFQVDYILSWSFESLTDKAMQIIIGFGVVSIVLVYSIADSIRFLPKLTDKFICVLSALMLKPILLPIFFPGFCFKSSIAVRKSGKYVHVFEGIVETRFMMAVQETNFLMTFTLSGVSAMTTFFAVC